MHVVRKLSVTLLLMCFLTSSVYIVSSAGSIAFGAATVSATTLNIRSQPSTSGTILATLSYNDKVVLLSKTTADWYQVCASGVTGYVAAQYLTSVLTAENFSATGQVSGSDVNMRSRPTTSSGTLATLQSGTTVQIIGINSGWYKVMYSSQTGYVRSDFVTLVASTTTPAQGNTSTDTAGSDTTTTPAPAPTTSTERQQLVDFAKQYVGGSYVYGGESPSEGFDCSGLVYYVFHHFNYDVTRTASSQYANDGTSIQKSALQPGDLVFFSSNGGYSVTHVGIYIGGNQFVHASCPTVGIVISSLDSEYYTSVWYGAKKVLP